MTNAIARITTDELASLYKKLILDSDLSTLTETELVFHYRNVCEEFGINPITKPFDLIREGKKLSMYPNKTFAAQMVQKHRVSTEIISRETFGGCYVITVRATAHDDAFSDNVGAVWAKDATGNAMANLIKKAVTQGTRRAVIQLCGGGFTDESEVEDVPDAIKEDASEIAALAAGTTQEQDAVITQWQEALEGTETPEQLTQHAKLLLNINDEIVKGKVRPMLKATQDRLGVTWSKDGKYVTREAEAVTA